MNELIAATGRINIRLVWNAMGDGLVVRIFNEQAHIGAVAIGEYSAAEQRASCSVITRLGHKDDAVAARAAHKLAKATQNPVCVVAGIHLDDITPAEIETVIAVCDGLIDQLVSRLK